ncbi:MAG: LPS export ABC transporter periplasmic protein LptC [Pseudomonadota bacterium]
MNALVRSDPPSTPWQNPAPWYLRAIDTASTYLPLLLMAALALGTWWLVKNTPLFEGDRAVAPLRHEPDYTMTQFMVQRFGASGAMRVQIEGDLMRHYPDTDTFEIDNPRIRTIGDDGRATTATARLALSNRDGSEVQLSGGAHVVRAATPTQTAIEFRGEFLHYFQFTERVRSHLPVVVTQGGSEIRADAMAYDNLARVLDLKGRVRAVLTPPAGTRP